MIKYFVGLILAIIIGYFVWPYVHIYQLNSAVADNDQAALDGLVDFETVNRIYQKDLEWSMGNMGPQDKSILPEAVREGANAVVGAVGNLVAQTTKIDANDMLKRLHKHEGSVWQQLTFAFFESPTRFTIRLGELGRSPIHLQMTLQDWRWRITAIYD